MCGMSLWRIGGAATLRLLLIAGVAPCVAQELTLYGRVELNLTKFGDSAIEVSQASSSRWGLLGRSPLTQGWRTEYQLESGFRADAGTLSGGLFARESWVGVGHPQFGLLRVGRTLTPSQRISVNYDPNNTDSIGTFGPSGLMLGQTVLSRFSNGVFYETPSAGGFTVFSGYQIDETKDKSDDSVLSVRLRFRSDELDVAIAHAEISQGNRVSSLGGSYRIGGVRPMAQFHTGRRGGERRDHWLAGATIGLSTGELRIALLGEDDRSLKNADRRLVSAGYDYSLSKRSLLYATYARDQLRGMSARNGIELGMRHSF
jgi:general bacterial porin, GBP family